MKRMMIREKKFKKDSKLSKTPSDIIGVTEKCNISLRNVAFYMRCFAENAIYFQENFVKSALLIFIRMFAIFVVHIRDHL